jgi:hypothetical protein
MAWVYGSHPRDRRSPGLATPGVARDLGLQGLRMKSVPREVGYTVLLPFRELTDWRTRLLLPPRGLPSLRQSH